MNVEIVTKLRGAKHTAWQALLTDSGIYPPRYKLFYGFIIHDKKSKYYILGRCDDVVLTPSGEKVNPDVIEQMILLPSAERFCLIGLNVDNINYLTLIVELP